MTAEDTKLQRSKCNSSSLRSSIRTSSLSLNFHRVMQTGPEVLAHTVGCAMERNPKLKELGSFVMGSKPPDLCPESKRDLQSTGQPINLLSAPKGTLSYFPRPIFTLPTFFEKMVQNKGISASVHETCSNMKAHGELSPHNH